MTFRIFLSMSNNLTCKNILPTKKLFFFYKKHQIYSFPVLEVLDLAPYCTYFPLHGNVLGFTLGQRLCLSVFTFSLSWNFSFTFVFLLLFFSAQKYFSVSGSDSDTDETRLDADHCQFPSLLHSISLY